MSLVLLVLKIWAILIVVGAIAAVPLFLFDKWADRMMHVDRNRRGIE